MSAIWILGNDGVDKGELIRSERGVNVVRVFPPESVKAKQLSAGKSEVVIVPTSKCHTSKAAAYRAAAKLERAKADRAGRLAAKYEALAKVPDVEVESE